jgi:hypothetical protein
MTLRKRVLKNIGPTGMHSLQDGFTLGTIGALALTYPPAVALIAGAIGLDGISLKKLTKKADQFVREEDIQKSPEYFVIGFLLGGVVGYGFGMGARIAGLPMSP